MTNEQVYDYMFEHRNDLARLPPGYGGMSVIQGSFIYLSAWSIYRRMVKRNDDKIRNSRLIAKSSVDSAE